MFVIIIYDSDEDLIWVARDRVGKKPLYYFQDNLSNMKNTWKGINNIININNNRGSQINQLKYNGKNINNDVGMANAFNDFFPM